ncbi:MAG: hypothetical protein AABX37_05645, partial [Nanoarchaeota archaeon]
FVEGEIQRLSKNKAKKLVYAEIHELITGMKKGRENNQEITLYDSVGIALEDYSALRLTHELAEKYQIGEERILGKGIIRIPYLGWVKILFVDALSVVGITIIS